MELFVDSKSRSYLLNDEPLLLLTIKTFFVFKRENSLFRQQYATLLKLPACSDLTAQEYYHLLSVLFGNSKISEYAHNSFFEHPRYKQLNLLKSNDVREFLKMPPWIYQAENAVSFHNLYFKLRSDFKIEPKKSAVPAMENPLIASWKTTFNSHYPQFSSTVSQHHMQMGKYQVDLIYPDAIPSKNQLLSIKQVALWM